MRIITFVAAFVAALAIAPAADATATQLQAPTNPNVSHPKAVVGYTFHPAKHRLNVTFHDGSRWAFTPCAEEDSPNCYWWATKRGNGIGHSFVDLHGKVHYLPA